MPGALVAAIGTGLVPPGTDWARVDVVVLPDGAACSVYDELHTTCTEL